MYFWFKFLRDTRAFLGTEEIWAILSIRGVTRGLHLAACAQNTPTEMWVPHLYLSSSTHPWGVAQICCKGNRFQLLVSTFLSFQYLTKLLAIVEWTWSDLSSGSSAIFQHPTPTCNLVHLFTCFILPSVNMLSGPTRVSTILSTV